MYSQMITEFDLNLENESHKEVDESKLALPEPCEDTQSSLASQSHDLFSTMIENHQMLRLPS